MKFRHIETPIGKLCVWFIVRAFGRDDYGISRDGVECGRITIADDGSTDATVNPDRASCWLKDHGFERIHAENAVREYIRQRFDDDVREIVRMGIMEFSEPAVKQRAAELGLVPVS